MPYFCCCRLKLLGHAQLLLLRQYESAAEMPTATYIPLQGRLVIVVVSMQ